MSERRAWGCRVHQVANGSSTQSASYLLIQGVGRYDFNPVDPEGRIG